MECTVGSSTIIAKEGCTTGANQSNVDKLQDLMQAFNLNDPLLQSSDHNNPPRDSGIDMSASCSDELDDEILDLDRFDIPDDDESWLYASPCIKKQGDVLSWLRKDMDRLDPASRRALATKLETLALKQNGVPRLSDAEQLFVRNDAHRSSNGMGDCSKNTSGIDLAETTVVLDSGDSFLSADRSNGGSDIGRSVSRSTTFRVTQSQSGAGGVGTATPLAKPKNTAQTIGKETNEKQTLGTNASDNQAGKFDGLLPPDLNADLHDIQLLASMQEEELRKNLQNMRRRRTSSGNRENDAGYHQQMVKEYPVNSTPVAAASNTSNRFATYRKTVSRNGKDGTGTEILAPAATSITSQKVAGLQKSLPNLSGSKSDFNLPVPIMPVDTTSEKGSYGDIPDMLNGVSATRSNVGMSTPRVMGSRLPTPARGRLRTPGKSAIPVPKSSNGLTPMTSASRDRTRSPVPKFAVPETITARPTKDDWNEGCF